MRRAIIVGAGVKVVVAGGVADLASGAEGTMTGRRGENRCRAAYKKHDTAACDDVCGLPQCFCCFRFSVFFLGSLCWGTRISVSTRDVGGLLMWY